MEKRRIWIGCVSAAVVCALVVCSIVLGRRGSTGKNEQEQQLAEGQDTENGQEEVEEQARQIERFLVEKAEQEKEEEEDEECLFGSGLAGF